MVRATEPGRPRPTLRLAGDLAAAVALAAMLVAVYAVDAQRAPADDAPPPVAAVPPSPADDPPPPEPTPEELAASLPPPPPPAPPPPPPLPTAVESPPVVRLRFADAGHFGLSCLGGNPDDPGDDGKRLTFAEAGGTNNTRVRVDGASPIFGGFDGSTTGRLRERADGTWTADWVYRGVRVRQEVRLVPGDVPRRRDTARVVYTVENVGPAVRRVGLRVMLDTLIGDNDGVPFLVPGRQGIVTEPVVMTGRDVPDFVRSLERPTLESPGVVVNIGLAPAEGEERPERLVLSHWPGSGAEWDYDRNAPLGEDSAVGLYYATTPMTPGATRKLGFSYGLGTVSSAASKNAGLSLTAGGPARPRASFYLMALVKNPKAGQTVRLALPDGLTAHAETPLTQPVTGAGEVTQLSWLIDVRPNAAGRLDVGATLSPDGVTETHSLDVVSPDTTLTLVPRGPFRAGGVFWLAAVASNPRAGQAVTLTLPAGLTLRPPATASQPLGPAGGTAQVLWPVEIGRTVSGRVEVRAALEPGGVADRKTLAVEPAEPQITLIPRGPFRAGRRFWVSAVVRDPRDGQSATLTLPTDLTPAEGHPATKPVTADARGVGRVNWLVTVAAPARGRRTLSARLVPDGPERQAAVEIEPGDLIR